MTAKKLGGLGRGLGAIYDDFDVSGLSEEDGDDKRLETVKLDELRPGSTQPRSTMTEEGLQELADSIRQQGIISPIIVRPADEGYEIIAGERRFRAARMAGLSRRRQASSASLTSATTRMNRRPKPSAVRAPQRRTFFAF